MFSPVPSNFPILKKMSSALQEEGGLPAVAADGIELFSPSYDLPPPPPPFPPLPSVDRPAKHRKSEKEIPFPIT
jgi:hypothetical protein